MRLSPEGHDELVALVAPLPAQLGGGGDRKIALIVLQKPGGLVSDPSVLRQAFGLTTAETELAQSLLAGQNRRLIPVRPEGPTPHAVPRPRPSGRSSRHCSRRPACGVRQNSCGRSLRRLC